MAEIAEPQPGERRIIPPEFRIFRITRGEILACANPECYSNKASSGGNRGRFEVSVSESAVTLTCAQCHEQQVVITNKLVEE